MYLLSFIILIVRISSDPGVNEFDYK